MKLPRVVTIPNPILRQTVDPVERFDDRLSRLAEQMLTVMHRAEGVGLAANQVGINARLFVYGIDEPFEANGKTVAAVPYQAIVNPEVTVIDSSLDMFEEGCLSIPGLRGPVARAVGIELSGFDLQGKPFRRQIHGYEARIVQHEVDHLNGRLFLDYITDPTKLHRIDEDE